ncbi:MAG: DNA mismatch endonuclease Vsr, partial [Akkermansia sp.]
MDRLDKTTRSRVMSAIGHKDTTPEVSVRKSLFHLGLRYRLHDKTLPGKPDLVFPKYKSVIFIHGCFWHSHDCKYGRLPSSNTDFWEQKLKRNVERDHVNIRLLSLLGWRVKIIWTCSLKNKK